MKLALPCKVCGIVEVYADSIGCECVDVIVKKGDLLTWWNKIMVRTPKGEILGKTPPEEK
jgi:hypothetical protein